MRFRFALLDSAGAPETSNHASHSLPIYCARSSTQFQISIERYIILSDVVGYLLRADQQIKKPEKVLSGTSQAPPRSRCSSRRLRSGRCDGAACSRVVLQGERELQRLLLAALHHLFPQLALVLHALQLRLDVLLRDLEEPQDGVVRLLRDHVQDVAEPLRAPLAPRLVDAERHVLRAVLPTEELDVRLCRIGALRIVEARAREDANHLRELHNAFVSDAVQCFRSSNGFSFTFVSNTS